MVWLMATSVASPLMPSWHYLGETQRQRPRQQQQQRLQQSLGSHATAELPRYGDCRDGLRHRLGIPTHLASSVGEALRPGPIDASTADDLADMLEMHDEHMSVSWPAGMSAGILPVPAWDPQLLSRRLRGV